MKNPPFEITQAMLADAAEIAELVGRLSASKRSASPILRRTNRIRTIQGTLAIEQNSLSVEQVTAVLNGKLPLADQFPADGTLPKYGTHTRFTIQ